MAIGVNLDAERDGLPAKVEISLEGETLVLSIGPTPRKRRLVLRMSIHEFSQAVLFYKNQHQISFAERDSERQDSDDEEPSLADEPAEPGPLSADDRRQIEGVGGEDDFRPPTRESDAEESFTS